VPQDLGCGDAGARQCWVRGRVAERVSRAPFANIESELRLAEGADSAALVREVRYLANLLTVLVFLRGVTAFLCSTGHGVGGADE